MYLKDIWPTQKEVSDTVHGVVTREMFQERYGDVFKGPQQWQAINVAAESDTYRWNSGSTYVQNPPYFEGMTRRSKPLASIHGARVLAVLGDSITTDHISPAGNIRKTAPAGEYLVEHQVRQADFNSYGARRGNHEVMMRGTFANIRIRNEMVPGIEGGITKHQPSGEQMPIYDAAMRYKREGVPLVVFGGKEYGTGSSRDWAAKGTFLLGVKAVIAESFERIHRSNLVGMGVLPLTFTEGQDRKSLGITGEEVIDILGLEELRARMTLEMVIHRPDGQRGPGASFSAASIRRTRSSTTRTAASCTTCCAGWPRRRSRGAPPAPERRFRDGTTARAGCCIGALIREEPANEHPQAGLRARRALRPRRLRPAAVADGLARHAARRALRAPRPRPCRPVRRLPPRPAVGSRRRLRAAAPAASAAAPCPASAAPAAAPAADLAAPSTATATARLLPGAAPFRAVSPAARRWRGRRRGRASPAWASAPGRARSWTG